MNRIGQDLASLFGLVFGECHGWQQADDIPLGAINQQIIGHTPMARFGDPQELAGVVIWLASAAASSFVTGQNIVVDGGFSATTI